MSITPSPVEAILLGAAQDGGLPQAGCGCATCEQARCNPQPSNRVCCLGLVDRAAGLFWLVDATPDLREQLYHLQDFAAGCRWGGILITHAHMGHYAGLLHLGREAMNTRCLPLYGSPAFGAFLQANAPWRQLLESGNLDFRALTPGEPLALTPDLAVTPLPVPHRAEYTDTLAYLVSGPRQALFFCPDIDRWEPLPPPLSHRPTGGGVGVALLDGTFFDQNELPGRRMDEVPHPPVRAAVELLADMPYQTWFVHLNHTNPLWREGPERTWLAQRGFGVGQGGQVWAL